MYSDKEFVILLFLTSLLGYGFWRGVEYVISNFEIAVTVLEDE